MYIVFLQWILHKTFIRFKFDLNLAIAMVWISNPLTVFPLHDYSLFPQDNIGRLLFNLDGIYSLPRIKLSLLYLNQCTKNPYNP